MRMNRRQLSTQDQKFAGVGGREKEKQIEMEKKLKFGRKEGKEIFGTREEKVFR